MSDLPRTLAMVGGNRSLLALGSVYVLAGAGYSFVPWIGDTSVAVDLIMLLLVSGPGVVLVYTAYRLPATDIRSEFYVTISTWCVGAISLILAVLFLVEVAIGLRDPLQNVLILTALASLAGLAAGRYDARAKTRTRELELRNRELERTKEELEQTVDQLKTANERLEQFAYAASHDLQEPLRMVSSYLQLLENRYQGELDDDALEFIDFAVGGADRMRAMVESLLEYSRISTRGEPLEPTDASAVFDDVLADLQRRIEETDATITVDQLPTVTADADQLAQVFRHLLSNALTYSGDDPPAIHVGAERAGDMWRFSVADEGIGVDPEFHERIFTVFENFHPGETDADAGGIGLALCERIIERHGGDIWVESDRDEGATFYFEIPGADAPQPEPAADPPVHE